MGEERQLVQLLTTHDSSHSLVFRHQHISVASRHIMACSGTRSLRSSDVPLLYVPFRRIAIGKRSFSCAAPTTWNSLPASIISCDTKLTSSILHKPTGNFSAPPTPLKLRHYGAVQAFYYYYQFEFYLLVDSDSRFSRSVTPLVARPVAGSIGLAYSMHKSV